MLINIYEILDAAIVGGVVGIFIVIIGYIKKFFKKSENVNSGSTITNKNDNSGDSKIGEYITLIALVIGLIFCLSKGAFMESLVFLFPLTLAIYWIKKGDVKNDNKIKSTNKKVEVISKVKKDNPINITALSDDLTKLGELKEKGLLTEEEFNEQKKKLLKQ
tara:strand:+ start:144 stop:629 length:486 start_codon:yes stop_codon:yes gene_type:complete